MRVCECDDKHTQVLAVDQTRRKWKCSQIDCHNQLFVNRTVLLLMLYEFISAFGYSFSLSPKRLNITQNACILCVVLLGIQAPAFFTSFVVGFQASYAPFTPAPLSTTTQEEEGVQQTLNKIKWRKISAAHDIRILKPKRIRRGMNRGPGNGNNSMLRVCLFGNRRDFASLFW